MPSSRLHSNSSEIVQKWTSLPKGSETKGENLIFGTRPHTQERIPCWWGGKENSKPSIKIIELLHLLHYVMPHWGMHGCYRQSERQWLVVHWDHDSFLRHPDGDFSSDRCPSLSTFSKGNSSENTWARVRLWATSVVVSRNKALWAREKIEIEAVKTRARVFHAVHLFHMLASRQWT